jgi:iron complex transport system permease protein
MMGLVLSVVLVVVAIISLASGYMSFTASEIIDVLWSKLTGSEADVAYNRAMVLLEVRLPRLATAIFAGAALGLSGAVFQGLLLNPLADPYTLGVSSGAAFGASLVLVGTMVLPWASFLATPMAPAIGAFLFSALTLRLVIALASDSDRHLSPASLILSGVILSAILSAGISFIKYLAGDQVSSIIFWLLGSFQARTWVDALLVLVFLLPSLALSLTSATDLNIMTLGFKSAETLGVNTAKVRLRLLAAASLAASASVAVAGIIGFVGLIVPHLVRLLTGPDHRSLLPLSTLGGAVLLCAADTVVRAFLPGEIPVGVLTALLAGPAFMVIFRRKMRDLIHA